MNRRSFIQSAGAFFAALATGGPKLLGQRPWPQFTDPVCAPPAGHRWVFDGEYWTFEPGVEYRTFRSGGITIKAPRRYSIEWTDGVPVRSNPDYLIAGHPIDAEFVTVYDLEGGTVDVDGEVRRVERAPDGRSWAVVFS